MRRLLVVLAAAFLPSEAETTFSFAGLTDLLGTPATSCPSCRRSSGGRSRPHCCCAIYVADLQGGITIGRLDARSGRVTAVTR